MELKDKLYNLRKKNGYTQSEIAEILEVSRQSVSNWELGTILPSTSRLKKLSNLYSVPLETLLDDGIEIPLHSEKNHFSICIRNSFSINCWCVSLLCCYKWLSKWKPNARATWK